MVIQEEQAFNSNFQIFAKKSMLEDFLQADFYYFVSKESQSWVDNITKN